jgi:hypothetical protein
MKKIIFTLISFFTVFIFVSNSLAETTTFDFEDLDLSNWAFKENKSSVAYQRIVAGSLNGNGNSLLEVEITNAGDPSSEMMASYYEPSMSWNNYNVSFDFEIFTSWCCFWHYMNFYFYSQSANLDDNTYQITTSNQNNTIVLSKNVNGVGTELASASYSFSDSFIYHIDVEAKEGQIKVYVDNSLVMDVSDSTFSSGAFGLGVSNAGADNNKVHFDNVIVDTSMNNIPVPNNAPVANADSILIHEENKDCLIAVDATAIDPDDNLESVMAYIELPSLEGLDIKLKKNHKTKVNFNLEEEKVKIKSPDPQGLLEEIVEYGGIAVKHGQNIWIRTSDDYSKYELQLKKDILQIKAPEVTLYVTATDSDGLSDTAKAGPLCSHENDDVADDDDDDHRHRGHMSYYNKRHHE